MKIYQLKNILDKSDLSPEVLSGYLQVSNMTYRRWLKRGDQEDVPAEYQRNIAGGIYRLIEDGKLDSNSPGISDFLASNIPEFFGAVTGNFGLSEESLKSESTQQEKVFQILAHIGASGKIQGDIDRKHKKINAFSRMGDEWKSRISGLIGVLKSKEINTVDKAVAYGALFYLLSPFDLIPDAVPVVGYIDDFAMLGFAMAYYAKMHKHLFPAKVSAIP